MHGKRVESREVANLRRRAVPARVPFVACVVNVDMYIFVNRRASGREENEEEGNLRGIYEEENSLNHPEIEFIDTRTPRTTRTFISI